MFAYVTYVENFLQIYVVKDGPESRQNSGLAVSEADGGNIQDQPRGHHLPGRWVFDSSQK